MRNSLLLAASAAVLMMSASTASAQISAGNLALGRQSTVQIPSEGADYTLSLRAGQRIEAILRAGDFDAYQQLFAADDLDLAVASNDDGFDSGTDSRLVFTPTTSGSYILRASSLNFEDSGSATLVVNEIAPVREPRAGRLALGRNISGRLGESSGETDEGRRYDPYRIQLSQGDRVAFTMKSDDFDSYLIVGERNNGVFAELVANDDGGNDGLNSYIVFTAPRTAEYEVRASGLSRTDSGRYEIKAQQGPAAPVRTPIAVGETVDGVIDDKSSPNTSGTVSAYYTFSGQAGQPYEITLNSDDFDTFVEVFDAYDVSLGSDDDSNGDLNSRLLFTPTTSGDFTIEARAFSEGTGDFELKLVTTEPPPPPMPLSIGRLTEGELTDNSASLGGNERYDAYSLPLQAGQRVQIVLRSSEFDTVLEIDKEGDSFSAIATDDDGLGDGTNSRLLFQPETSGTYIVRVRGYGGNARGAYDIEASDRGPEPQAGSILVGATVRSSLSDRDNTSDSGAYYNDYEFHGRANEKLRFTLISPDFDALVKVGTMRNGTFRELAEDDDGLSDTHARLNWTVPSEGNYIVRVTSFAGASVGGYVLVVEPQP